jgi:hypothetical protein
MSCCALDIRIDCLVGIGECFADRLVGIEDFGPDAFLLGRHQELIQVRSKVSQEKLSFGEH